MLVFLGALMVLIAACDSDGDSADSSEGPAILPATVVVPSGLPLVEGIPVVTVLGPPESDAGEVPLFSWEPVAGASRYTVAVLGPDAPFWAWQGEETEIYLGGLPFERPPGWAGPVILPGSCWSVTALGADGTSSQRASSFRYRPLNPQATRASRDRAPASTADTCADGTEPPGAPACVHKTP